MCGVCEGSAGSLSRGPPGVRMVVQDKWRNLLRIAMLPSPPAPKSGDKKREIPASLLMRVRELAARAAKNRPPDGRSNRGRSRLPNESP